jgi:gluconolactonase
MTLRLALAMAAILLAAPAAASAAAAPAADPGPHKTITAIPGVVAAGARLQLVLAVQDGMDGIVGSPDGGVLFAKEHQDSLRKVDAAGKETVLVTDTHGAGSLGMDNQGRVYAIQRTCTDPAMKWETPCAEPPMVGILHPERRTLAKSFADGKPLPRLSDLVVDTRGGVYFTGVGIFYVDRAGKVSVVADQNIRTNGLALSPDGKTLYTTNATEVVAFDVAADGSTSNRRVFAGLDGDTNADGMAVDQAGRLYASGVAGIHVLSPDGKAVGLIPTNRRVTSLAFSGPGKRTLYVILAGMEGPDGKVTNEEKSPAGARTLYKLAVLTPGVSSRPK